MDASPSIASPRKRAPGASSSAAWKASHSASSSLQLNRGKLKCNALFAGGQRVPGADGLRGRKRSRIRPAVRLSVALQCMASGALTAECQNAHHLAGLEPRRSRAYPPNTPSHKGVPVHAIGTFALSGNVRRSTPRCAHCRRAQSCDRLREWSGTMRDAMRFDAVHGYTHGAQCTDQSNS